MDTQSTYPSAPTWNDMYCNPHDGCKHKTIFNSFLEDRIKGAGEYILKLYPPKPVPPKPVPEDSAESERPARFYWLHWPTFLDNGPHFHFHGTSHNSKSSRSSSSSSNSNDDMLFYLAGGIAAAAIFVFAYYYGSYANTRDNIKALNTFEVHLASINPLDVKANPYNKENPHYVSMRAIYHLYSEFLHKRLASDKTNCKTALAFAASSIVIIGGGVLVSSSAMFVGKVALVATLTCTLYRVISEYQRENEKQIDSLDLKIEKLTKKTLAKRIIKHCAYLQSFTFDQRSAYR